LQAWSSHGGLLIGGGLRLLEQALPWLAWSIAGDFGTAGVDVSLGTVRMTTASTALCVALRLGGDPVAFYSGPGGRIGFVRMSGEPADRTRTRGDHFFAPYGGVIWWTRLEYASSPSVRLGLDLELGVTTLPVKDTVDQRELLSLEGVWFTSGLTLGVAF
jgi:hypothetical protein